MSKKWAFFVASAFVISFLSVGAARADLKDGLGLINCYAFLQEGVCHQSIQTKPYSVA